MWERFTAFVYTCKTKTETMKWLNKRKSFVDPVGYEVLLPPKLYFKFCCSLYHSDGWNLMRRYQILIWQIQRSFWYRKLSVTTTLTVLFNFNFKSIFTFDSTTATWSNFVLLVDFDLGSAMIERDWELELGHYNAPRYSNMAYVLEAISMVRSYCYQTSFTRGLFAV